MRPFHAPIHKVFYPRSRSGDFFTVLSGLMKTWKLLWNRGAAADTWSLTSILISMCI